jgi:hypothetical protein
MRYDDGRNSARARSARIRASHDYEATLLEEMRRRTLQGGEPEFRRSLATRLTSAFGRLRGSNPGPAHVPAAENEVETTALAGLGQ